ncbi:MAG: ABC transporter ATP-binding protein [Candidatus Kapaibacteriota bacterium]
MREIKLVDISKEFGTHKVLENITFEANEDDFCVLVGPSGCGKTTILRIISGLETPSAGSILYNNVLWNNVPPGERNVGMVFQNYALYPHLTVYENIAFPLTIKKIDKKTIEEKVQRVAKLLNLEDKLKKKPKALSGGERQRVSLGRAIIRQPNVFLFDEPLSNLDAKLRVVMRSEIVNLCKELKIPSIYVTHDQIEALTMGSKILVLNEGKIQQIGTPKEIYYHPANTFVATFIGVPQMNLFEGFVEDGIFYEINKLFKMRHEKFSGFSGKLLLGVRPEAIFLTNEEDSIITTRVKTFEYIGYETIIYFESNGKIFSFITNKNQDLPKERENIHLGFRSNDLHFFDETGSRIELNKQNENSQ